MTATKPAIVEHPILFSSSMVKAILEGRKTQTRRVINPQPEEMQGGRGGVFVWGYKIGASKTTAPRSCSWHHETWMKESGTAPINEYCPYGQVGHRLWVRETWAAHEYYNSRKPADIPEGVTIECQTEPEAVSVYPELAHRKIREGERGKWRPSIFMPRWASRISLEIVSVRVERLQSISPSDAIAEGAVCSGDPNGEMGKGNVPKWSMTGETDWQHCLDTAYWAFANGWNHINGKRKGCTWDDNPFVWVVEFNVVA